MLDFRLAFAWLALGILLLLGLCLKYSFCLLALKNKKYCLAWLALENKIKNLALLCLACA
jgi:hypothetical protein